MVRTAVIVSAAGASSVAERVETLRRLSDAAAGEKYAFSVFLNTEGEEGLLALQERTAAAGFDHLFLLDADIRPCPEAFLCLLENAEFLRHKAIIAGTVTGPDGVPLFGGRTRRGRLVQPDPTIPVPCHLFDLSCTLVPVCVFDLLHTPAELFRRTFWDYGFGVKAAAAGIPRVVAPGILAQTDRIPDIPLWRDPDTPVWQRPLMLARSFLRECIKALRAFFR